MIEGLWFLDFLNETVWFWISVWGSNAMPEDLQTIHSRYPRMFSLKKYGYLKSAIFFCGFPHLDNRDWKCILTVAPWQYTLRIHFLAWWKAVNVQQHVFRAYHDSAIHVDAFVFKASIWFSCCPATNVCCRDNLQIHST